ncbi:hypothetical protein EGR_10781 [Echinococcus granulosus]|uniref:Uncharacterized protein n=1 Tax=Echinococcus granulosus TaxID=6210 RepID=W6ULE9_ECHGR|nr:hypothetical protein EGR_10781 [Echinococcus granulosus]EUB54359.1 hypothetical protein EGR_10781 [Echinococcus granulosus]
MISLVKAILPNNAFEANSEHYNLLMNACTRHTWICYSVKHPILQIDKRDYRLLSSLNVPCFSSHYILFNVTINALCEFSLLQCMQKLQMSYLQSSAVTTSMLSNNSLAQTCIIEHKICHLCGTFDDSLVGHFLTGWKKPDEVFERISVVVWIFNTHTSEPCFTTFTFACSLKYLIFSCHINECGEVVGVNIQPSMNPQYNTVVPFHMCSIFDSTSMHSNLCKEVIYAVKLLQGSNFYVNNPLNPSNVNLSDGYK